jgi:hypothetical protein
MLIRNVEKLEPGNPPGTYYSCATARAEIKLEHEDEFYLCDSCAMQVARAFMEDVCQLLPKDGGQR